MMHLRIFGSLSLAALVAGTAMMETPHAVASTVDGTIDLTHRFTWGENTGWIDFGSAEGNVRVSDTSLSGYAWGENVGWISLSCGNDASCATVEYKVTNNGFGVLRGYAWSENTGWIDFHPVGGGVTINASGVFSGYAWGENVGWISFNCSDAASCSVAEYRVTTDWRPVSARSSSNISSSVASTRGGGGARAKARIERGGTLALAPVTPRAVTPTADPPSPRMLAIQRRLATLDMKLAKATRSDDRQRLERAREALQRVLQRLRTTRR